MNTFIKCMCLLSCLMAAEYGELKHNPSLITVGLGGLALMAIWLAYRALQSNED